MTISTPPVWSDPAGSTVDVANGGIWTAAAIDGICSDLKALGGADGASGLAAPNSYLVNGGLEIWQRTAASFSTNNGFAADRWALNLGGSACVVTKETTITDGGSGSATSAKLVQTFATTAAYLFQPLEDFAALRGRMVTFSARVYSSVPGVLAQITDSGGATGGTVSTLTNTWETISVTRLVNAAASSLIVQVVLPGSNCTTYVDSAMLVVGQMPAIYVPRRQAEEWHACLRYYEIIGGTTGAGSINVGGYNDAGITTYTTLQYKAQKAIVPTVTVVGTWGVNNCGQPAVTSPPSLDAVRLQITNTASGYANAVNNSAMAYVTVEANP